MTAYPVEEPGGDLNAMECLVVVRAEGPDQYSARAVAVPEVQAVGRTEAEAIKEVGRSLTKWFHSARLVHVEVPAPVDGNPWLETFGRSADDPDFDDFLAEMQRGRATGPE